MKRLPMVLAISGSLLLAATSVAHARGGPMGPATLIEKGWGCFADESHGVWAHCWPRGTDFFSFPPSMLNLNYATFDLEEDADFLGTEVLIREDIFNGQPCPQGTTADGEYELVPDIGGPGTPDYYSCHHFDEVPEF